jgi:hypothetical protein
MNGAKDKGIDIRSIRKFAEDIRPRYKDHAARFDFFEDENADHECTTAMKERAIKWLDRHLVERPIRVERREARWDKNAPGAERRSP